MQKLRLVAGSVGIMLATAWPVSAQTFPSKIVRIVTAEAGGGVDFAARLIAQGLVDNLGQQVIVDNRGGGGVIAAEVVTKAPPDGHTILLYGSVIWLLPFLRSNVKYDPLRDFSAVALITKAPNILVVHPSLPTRSVRDLIALAKARPGELNYASGSTGSSNHLAAELFKTMAGVNIMHVPYKGVAPAFNDLVGGRVQVMFAIAAGVMPHVRTGRLRALAITSLEPSALVPGLPTVAASGVSGYEAVSILGIFAPGGTPEALVNRLNQEVVRVLNKTAVKEKFFNSGVEVVGSTPGEFAARVKSEMVKWGKLIKDSGIHEG